MRATLEHLQASVLWLSVAVVLRAVGDPFSVIYSATPPRPPRLGQLWVDTSANPAVLNEAISLSPVTYQTVGGGGGGTVTSVGLTDGSTTPIFAISGSPVIASGTLAFTLNTQTANRAFAGPVSGGAAQPGFRALVIADLPTAIPNANLANSSLTVTASTGLSGGGLVSLGGSVSLSLTSPVTAILGGTGQTVYAVGDLLYADTTTSLARRGDVAAGSYLRSGGVNTAPVWSTVTIPNAATLGDLWYASATSAISALAGTTSATKQFLTQTGNGSVSAAPAWGAIATGDVPDKGANPTASLGLAAINGSAATWMRSDGAPALSQAIAPTWTGLHTFAPSAAGAGAAFAAGTTTKYAFQLTAGTNLTTAVAGAVEFDGTTPYFTPFATCRGVNMVEFVQAISAAYTLVSQTAAQKLLNATSTGAITLPIGVYEFECCFSLTAMSSSSGSFGFALGGTATHTDAWWAEADKVTTLATASTTAATTFNTGANTTLVAANLLTAGWARIRGIIRVTVAGTIIPQVSLGVAAAAVVGANSFFRIVPIGPSGFTTVGQWT